MACSVAEHMWHPIQQALLRNLSGKLAVAELHPQCLAYACVFAWNTPLHFKAATHDMPLHVACTPAPFNLINTYSRSNQPKALVAFHEIIVVSATAAVHSQQHIKWLLLFNTCTTRAMYSCRAYTSILQQAELGKFSTLPHKFSTLPQLNY